MEYFQNISSIVIDIGSFDKEKSFKYISSLSIIQQYSYVKINNLKNNTEYNNQIGQVEKLLENNKYKVYLKNKYLSISIKNITLYPIILFFKPEEINIETLKYYNTSFNIPLSNNKNYIAIFYKGDYYFENMKTLTDTKLEAFFNNASYEIYTKCNICFIDKYNLIACNQCIYTFCEECLIKFKNKSCPYCNYPLHYKII